MIWLVVLLFFVLVLIYFQYRPIQPEYELANVDEDADLDEDAELDEYELESNESDEFRIQI